MRIAVAADEDTGVARAVLDGLRARGHDPVPHGALAVGERADWAWASEAAARAVAGGEVDQAVVCCWTGTGASIAANKVPGVRAALCADATTAAGARRWNDANVLALSLRTTSAALLEEILDAWFVAAPSTEPDDAATSRTSANSTPGRGASLARGASADSPAWERRAACRWRRRRPARSRCDAGLPSARRFKTPEAVRAVLGWGRGSGPDRVGA